MKQTQISLGNKSVEQNRTFLKALYQSEDLEGARKWFDRLDCSVSPLRQRDQEMTLENYLSLITDHFHIVLQLGSPFPDLIRYCASGSDSRGVTRFAWLECPFKEHNYNLISGLFNATSGQNIEPKWL